MFGLFEKRIAPQEPVELVAVTPIAAAPQRVFSLIDFDDPANAKRELGHEVRKVDEGEFELIMNFMPDLAFPITVLERASPETYAYATIMPEGVGKLVRSEEAYRIEPDDAGGCVVAMTMTAELEPGLTMKQYDLEIELLTLALQNALGKIKVHAEGNIDDVRAFERLQAA